MSCSQVENVSPTTVTPNSTNTLVLSTETSTPTAVSPTFLPGTGWKTFVITNLQVAVDYPSDWLVSKQATGVSFISRSGTVIQLTKIDTGGLPPEEFLRDNQLPNTRCSTNANNYGIKVLSCLDTLTGSYSADFVMIHSQEGTQLLSITMLRKGDLQVFDRMVESIRPSTRPKH